MKSIKKLNDTKTGCVLNTFKNPLQTYINLDIEEFEDMDYTLGTSLFIISDRSVIDKCLEIHNQYPVDDPDEDLRSIQEFKVDNKFLTIIWESPNLELTDEIKESLNEKSLSLDKFVIQSQEEANKYNSHRLMDCSDFIQKKENQEFKEIILKLYDM